MGRGRTERGYSRYTRGSSMIYVVLLMTLLSVLSCGYMAVSRHNMQAALDSRRYMEAQLSAKTIHRSFCEAVSSGDSTAMNLVWQSFQEDCDRVREEFDAMMDEEEENEGEEADGRELEAEASEPGEDVAGEEETRWERYLYHALGNREYVVRGRGSSGDSGIMDDSAAEVPTEIEITLTAYPLKSLATVRTVVESSGYHFSMMADIVFDDRDGSVMIIRKPYRSSGGGGPDVKVYLNGNGVYRYYEGS
jgi:hypothetical protein